VEQDLLETQRNNYRRRDSKKHISVLYLASWLNGQGAAALHNLMEDAATAEISRSQLWQWLQNKVILDNGKNIKEVITLQPWKNLKIRNLVGDENHEKQKYRLAEQLLDELVVNQHLYQFLTFLDTNT
jgi:malate synthase